MAMKIVSQQTKKFTINGKEVECVVTRREGKVRRRDGWRQCVSTEGDHCNFLHIYVFSKEHKDKQFNYYFCVHIIITFSITICVKRRSDCYC